MKHHIALAALATALALTSPAFAGTGPSTPAPASRQMQVTHRTSPTAARGVEDLYRRAQQKLTDVHLYTGAVDGTRNQAFVQSLERFQRSHNIRANGCLNSETKAALGIQPNALPPSFSALNFAAACHDNPWRRRRFIVRRRRMGSRRRQDRWRRFEARNHRLFENRR